MPDNESKVAANEAFAAFLSHRHEVAIFANAEEALTSLSRRYKIGALTNGNADVRKTGIGKYFNFAWRAEEYGVSKPDPAFFQTAFAQVGVEPHEVIHVGDCHQNDVFGAAEAGAKAIWFKPEGGTSDIASKVVKKLSTYQMPLRLQACRTTSCVRWPQHPFHRFVCALPPQVTTQKSFRRQSYQYELLL